MLGTVSGTWLSMMKVLTAIITISKSCCSSIRRLTVNHVHSVKKKPQIKEDFREVTKF